MRVLEGSLWRIEENGIELEVFFCLFEKICLTYGNDFQTAPQGRLTTVEKRISKDFVCNVD